MDTPRALDTLYTSIIIVVERDTPCTSILPGGGNRYTLCFHTAGDGKEIIWSGQNYCYSVCRAQLLVRLVSFRTLVVQQTEFLQYIAGFFFIAAVL
jgi:hypothetical protein